MDWYLGHYLTQTYPELDEEEWKKTPDSTRVEIYTELNQREKAWVQIHLNNNPDLAKKLWLERECDELTHHVCPECGMVPEIMDGGGAFICLNLKCPYRDLSIDPEDPMPWYGFNHVKPSDSYCGFQRWDSWDN